MLNIDELENRWLKYKIKSFIPHIVIAISLLIILIITSIFTFKTKIEEKSMVKTEILKPKIEKKQNIEKQSDEQKLVITPSFNFMQNIQTTSIIEKKSTIYEKPISKVVTNQPQKIDIKRQNTKNDIKHVIERFNNNKNPVLSLFIAKKYYELKNYKQACQYAFITNELNNKIEDSWIIFIKSMIKLNQKDKAIKTLRQYIKHSNSEKAKILLNEIIAGRFK
ncbi:MAG: hypothetical protein U9N02_07980 [Campylobacterota bacterium]|nr:hypothetical protein [Campylobacterota bacterium]